MFILCSLCSPPFWSIETALTQESHIVTAFEKLGYILVGRGRATWRHLYDVWFHRLTNQKRLQYEALQPMQRLVCNITIWIVQFISCLCLCVYSSFIYFLNTATTHEPIRNSNLKQSASWVWSVRSVFESLDAFIHCHLAMGPFLGIWESASAIFLVFVFLVQWFHCGWHQHWGWPPPHATEDTYLALQSAATSTSMQNWLGSWRCAECATHRVVVSCVVFY